MNSLSPTIDLRVFLIVKSNLVLGSDLRLQRAADLLTLSTAWYLRVNDENMRKGSTTVMSSVCFSREVGCLKVRIIVGGFMLTFQTYSQLSY